MNRCLISIDLDGTLLRPDYSIGELTKSVIASAQKEGHVVLLSSGRPLRSLLPHYRALKCVGPLSAYNGELVRHPDNPACFPIIDPTFAKEDILSLFAGLEERLSFFMGEDGTTLVQNRYDELLDRYFPVEGIAFSMAASLSSLPNGLKIFIFIADDETKSEVERRIADYPHLHFHAWRKQPYCEITLSSCSKGTALMQAAAHYGIPKENTIAFGDSENDYPMLAASGHPFAMADCKSELLLQSFPATEKGNADDGVAFELLKLLS